MNSSECLCYRRIIKPPPPISLLKSPPIPPLPLLDLESNLFGGIQSSNLVDTYLKCKMFVSAAGSMTNNRTGSSSTRTVKFGQTSTMTAVSLNTTSFSASTSSLFGINSSYLFIILIVISILIVFLLLFIVFAFVLVYLTRVKIKLNDVKCPVGEEQNISNASSSNGSNTKTVSILSLSSESSSSTSPNSNSNYHDDESNLVIQLNPKLVNLNSFKCHQLAPAVLSSSSSSSPNKLTNDSNITNSTLVTLNSKDLSRFRLNSQQLQQHQQQQQHYYESIGDLSQFYFDVDVDSGSTSHIIAKKIQQQCNTLKLQHTIGRQSNNHHHHGNHYPITCCSCTLMKINENVGCGMRSTSSNIMSTTLLPSGNTATQIPNEQFYFKSLIV